MITKFCMVCLSVVSGSMVGLVLSKSSAQRVSYYKSLLAFIHVFVAEIKFRQENLRTVLAHFIESEESSFTMHLKEFLIALDGTELTLSKLKLKDAEIKEVKEFLLSLGSTDGETQLYELSNYQLKFEDKFNSVSEKHKKQGSIYIKLGFLVGLAVGIVIL